MCTGNMNLGVNVVCACRGVLRSGGWRRRWAPSLQQCLACQALETSCSPAMAASPATGEKLIRHISATRLAALPVPCSSKLLQSSTQAPLSAKICHCSMSAICMLWHILHLYASAAGLDLHAVWHSDSKQDFSAVTVWLFLSLLFHDSVFFNSSKQCSMIVFVRRSKQCSTGSSCEK